MSLVRFGAQAAVLRRLWLVSSSIWRLACTLLHHTANAVQTMASDIPLGRVGSTSKSTNSRHSISVHRLPSPAPSDEDVGPKPRSLRDVEGSIPKSLPDDPFLLRDALKTETELNELKHRKPNGKAVAAYQRKQNEVRAAAYSATP